MSEIFQYDLACGETQSTSLNFTGTYRLIEVVTHWVCQSSYGIIENEKILVLVLPKGKHQRVQDKAQVGNKLCACLLLQGGKRTKKQDGGYGDTLFHLYMVLLEMTDDTCRMWIREQNGNKVYHCSSMSWDFHHIHIQRRRRRSIKLLTCKRPPAPSCCHLGCV